MTIRFENPLRMVRELKGAPLSIVWVLGIVNQRVSQEFLQVTTGYTDKTISQALAYLKEVSLINHTQSGWMLIQNDSAQLPLPLAFLEPGSAAPAQDPAPGESEKFSDSSSSSSINLTNNNDLTTDSLNSAQVGKIPTQVQIQLILSAAADLFGHRIMGPPDDYQDLDRLLAWICQAWDSHGTGRGMVQSPAALVYWAFHKGKNHSPDPKYLDLENADRWLPESFMRKCGQWIFEDLEVENES